MKLIDYLYHEILGICPEPEKIETPPLPNVNNTIKVPWEFEKIQSIGFIICFDSFLYYFTYYPLRLLFALFALLSFIQSKIFQFLHITNYTTTTPSDSSNSVSKPSSLFSFTIVHIFDLLRCVLIVSSFYLLIQMNLSTIYHRIKSQNTIKLYVLCSMIEVIDKLFASFGGDLFDSIQIQLFQNQTLPIKQTFIAFVYVAFHALLYLLQVATFTVIIDSSATDSLLTILILNNFAELKGFVFKKYDLFNLFQLTCSDILERFHSIVLVVLVFALTMVQSGFRWWEFMNTFFTATIGILVAEAIADSFKHCFICKYNSLSALHYRSYGYVLIQDLLACGKDAVVVDHTYAVSRRLGICQIPLMAVVLRYGYVVFTSSLVQSYFSANSYTSLILMGLGIYLILLAIKVLFAVLLFQIATKAQDMNWFFGESRVTEELKKEVAKLKTMQRFTVHNGRIL